MPDSSGDVALANGSAAALIHDAASRTLTAIAAGREQSTGDAHRATTGVFIAAVQGIASVAYAVRSPQTTMLSIGSRRRVPIEGPDGAVMFVDMVTATLTCDPSAVDAARGAELLSSFRGFVEQPVTMIV